MADIVQYFNAYRRLYIDVLLDAIDLVKGELEVLMRVNRRKRPRNREIANQMDPKQQPLRKQYLHMIKCMRTHRDRQYRLGQLDTASSRIATKRLMNRGG